jgi:hypothetical protein
MAFTTNPQAYGVVTRGLRSSHIDFRLLDNLGTTRGDSFDSADNGHFYEKSNEHSNSGGAAAALVLMAGILFLLAVLTRRGISTRPENDASDGNTVGSLEDEEALDDDEVVKG